jgi:hypothetical protein
MACLWGRALDNFGYVAPHLNKTRGELRTCENDVLFQDKEQIRVSVWKDSRRAINALQFGLEGYHLRSSKFRLRCILNDPKAAV